MIYNNLVRLNSLIADFDRKEDYKTKLLKVPGFGYIGGDDKNTKGSEEV